MDKNRIGLSLEFFERLLTYINEYASIQKFGISLYEDDERKSQCIDNYRQTIVDGVKLNEILELAE